MGGRNDKRHQAVERSQLGFTLMEMLIVLVIIGLVAAVAIPQVMKLLESAKHKAAKIQIETIGQSLNHYALDMNNYPTQKDGLNALLTAPANDPNWDGPYVRGEAQLRDPWGRPLLYQAPGTSGQDKFLLRTLGADGAEGGSGDNRDIDYQN